MGRLATDKWDKRNREVRFGALMMNYTDGGTIGSKHDSGWAGGVEKGKAGWHRGACSLGLGSRKGTNHRKIDLPCCAIHRAGDRSRGLCAHICRMNSRMPFSADPQSLSRSGGACWPSAGNGSHNSRKNALS